MLRTSISEINLDGECLQVNKSFSMKMPPPYLSVNFCVQELSFPKSGTCQKTCEDMNFTVGKGWKRSSAAWLAFIERHSRLRMDLSG